MIRGIFNDAKDDQIAALTDLVSEKLGAEVKRQPTVFFLWQMTAPTNNFTPGHDQGRV